MSHEIRSADVYHKRPLPMPARPLIKRGLVLLPEDARRQALVIKKHVDGSRAMLCLLIAAHDEQMVIANTIRSAIRAGMKPRDIYVVDDNSSDKTSEIAKSILGEANVVKVKRSGKGLALSKASKKFNLTRRYRWIHIADADGGFA